jgi:hypothetical protein
MPKSQFRAWFLLLFVIVTVSAVPRFSETTKDYQWQQCAFASSASILRKGTQFAARSLLPARRNFRFGTNPITRLSSGDPSTETDNEVSNGKESVLKKLAGLDQSKAPVQKSREKKDPSIIDQVVAWFNSDEVWNQIFISKRKRKIETLWTFRGLMNISINIKHEILFFHAIYRHFSSYFQFFLAHCNRFSS